MIIKRMHSKTMVKLIFSSMLLFSIIRLCLPLASYAQTVKVNTVKATDQPTDYHVVQAGETLYSLSKKYNTTVAVLIELNPEIVNNTLSTGVNIKVPAILGVGTATNSVKGNAILYTVRKKETLYSLSKRYNTTVENLMLWNNLEEPTIEEGALLIVGYESPNLTIEGPLTVDAPTQSIPEDEVPSVVLESETQVMDSISSSPAFPDDLAMKGIATWVKSSGGEADFFALHPTAPKGTEVLVKNMMNGKTVTVKVIGKLPATSENEHVLIKISSAAANKLGVLDEKFLAALYYDGMHDENAELIEELK
jgi:LysM repeat protein